MTQTLYEVLDCTHRSTYEEIKQAYFNLAKKYHPDKDSSLSAEQFRTINEAWNTLRDAESRKQYDARLLNEQCDEYVIYATLSLNELDYDDENKVYSYECRCGGSYSLEAESAEDCIVNCNECSLAIRVEHVNKCS